MARIGVILVLLAGIISIPGHAARAQTSETSGITNQPDKKVLFQADEVNYDNVLNRVVAVGNVEITQGRRLLFADELTFDQNTDTVIASGNIRIIEPSGEVVFADYVELQDELKSGSLRGMGLLLTDNTRLAALSGRRYDNRYTEMRKAVMSPCDLCEDDPTFPPLWQLKAYKIIHDEEKKNIEYYSAFLELLGVPVFYIPYLYHADPTVDRRSGLLAPSYGNSDVLGIFVKVPVYLNLAPDMDATIEPIFLTEHGVIASGEFRKRFTFGQVEISGSFGILDQEDGGRVVQDDAFRGHIDARGEFHLTENLRAGGEFKRTSDDTYMRRFDFSNVPVLTSNGYVEGFYGRSYASANVWAFQGLRERDDRDTTPMVAPRLDYQHVGDADKFGGRLQLDANLLSLTRTEGVESRRASIGGEYRIPFMVGNGHLMSASAALRLDGYYTDGATRVDSTVVQDFTGRAFPQVALDWRYPLVKSQGSTQFLLEPQASLAAAPTGGNPDDISNEDSGLFDLTDDNLFEHNRFQGLDRVDGGVRATVGLTAGAYADNISASLFLGQSYSVDDNNAFNSGSGAQEQISDIVGRLRIDYAGWLQSLYRFRLDKDSLDPRRHEVDLRVGPSQFRVGAQYLLIDDVAGAGLFGAREEVLLNLSSQVSENWRINAAYRRDLEEESDRFWRAGVTYKNECVDFNAFFVRSFFRDRELEPSNTFGMRITLKNLGQIGSSF